MLIPLDVGMTTRVEQLFIFKYYVIKLYILNQCNTFVSNIMLLGYTLFVITLTDAFDMLFISRIRSFHISDKHINLVPTPSDMRGSIVKQKFVCICINVGS